MGGLAEVAIHEAMQALISGDARPPLAVVERDKKIDALEAEVERRPSASSPARADGRRSARGRSPRSRSPASSSGSATMPRISPSGRRPSRTARSSRLPCSPRWRGSPARWSTTCSTPTPRATRCRPREVIDRDSKVDAFYDSIFRNLVTYMMENPHNISRRRTCCSSPRTSSASATTPPMSPKWSISRRPASISPTGPRAPTSTEHRSDRPWRLRLASCWSRTTGRSPNCSSTTSRARAIDVAQHRRRRRGAADGARGRRPTSSSSTG